MAHWKETAVTDIGVEMLNEWMAGRKITITGAIGGTGKVDPETLAAQTGLVEPKATLRLMGEDNKPDGKTVQVQVNNVGLTEEFELNQVGVYAALDKDRNPDAEEKLLFIMQDEDGVTVPTEEDEVFLLELYCAIGITNNGRFVVTVDSTGLVTMGRMTDAIAAAVAAHNEDPDAHGGAIGGAQATVMEITIPAEGWGEDETGALHVDIAVEGMTAAMVPWLSIYPADMNTARMCAMSTSVQTMDGALRVYAQKEPDAAIRASLALLGASSTMVSGSGTGISAESVGEGLSVENGKLTIDTGTVVTKEDLVDENEVAEEVANILNG